ncbi:unnamed protein product, partial [Mesorhabditis spiculigera]
MKLFLFLCTLPSTCWAAFAQADKDEILDVHNSMRSRIALGLYTAKSKTFPAAADMTKMKWDSGLESQAQNWANRCQFAHSGTNGVGENIYMASSSNTLPIRGQGKAASNAWEKEFPDKGWPGVPYFDMNVFNSGIGHATQMAWASSSKIGCGATQCQNGKSVFVVCQYSKQGNYLNQNAYSAGTRCSKCPSGTSCDSRLGLCQ